MKILIPVIGFGRAGGYRVLSKLADELIILGHSVDFLCPEENSEPYYPTNANIKWINENGSILENKKLTVGKENFFSIQKKLYVALSKIKDCYEVIIANHSLTTLPIKKAGLIYKTLYYVQAYEPDMYLASGGLRNQSLAYLSARSYKMNFFTVVNAEIYLKYKKLNATKVLYPGIDFNLFHPENRVITNQSENKIILGTVGRAESYKGTRYIIEAYKKLKKKYSSIQLHVAFGNPIDFKNEKDIYCFQPHGDKALADFYRSLDFYICAGYFQFGAFHYPVAEAMSCGIAVITTPYYPANTYNAWLVSPKNADSIVSQFELAEKNHLPKAEKIQQALIDVKQFEWKAVGIQLNKFIEELVNNYSS